MKKVECEDVGGNDGFFELDVGMVIDAKGEALYVFGETTTEIEFSGDKSPFERVDKS